MLSSVCATDNRLVWLVGELSSSLSSGFIKTKKASVNSLAEDLLAHYTDLEIKTILEQKIVRKIHKVIDRHDS